MPMLRNSRQERFAQALAVGKSQADAYAEAGYKPHASNASTLAKDHKILARVQELIEKNALIETKAVARAIEKLSITKEAVLGELMKIGFAKVTDAVRWGDTIAVKDGDGNDKMVYGLALVPSDELAPETKAAISEISQTREGLKVKFHDKRAALVDLGRHLGLFIDRVEHGAPGDFAAMPDDELARELEAQAIGNGNLVDIAALLRDGSETVN